MFGWIGRILRVDLESGKISEEGLKEEILGEFLGGRGLGVRVIFEELEPRIDPLSPENKIVFSTGPLTGTPAPTSGRYCVVSKSPLTGTIFDSHSGGSFGPELKKAGYDAFVVEGESQEPAYVWIEDGEAELRDASGLWGLSTHETTSKLLELTDPGARVACIGPAGERLVKMAAIMNDMNRAAGRGGLGAVMGSKKLKAISVKGSGTIAVAEEEEMRELLRMTSIILRKNSTTDKWLPTLGTALLVNIINELGMFPTRNFQEGVFEDAEGISGEKMTETILVGKRACHACPIGCGRVTKTSNMEGEGPEYETIWAFGAQCGINDLEAIANANYLCNQLGLDTISTGNTIGCAMELSERGIIGDGIEFGDSEKMVELVRQIALRQGFGDELAEGSMRFAESHNRPDLAMQVKGLELPAYDPRGAQGHALAYATSNRGGCHLRAYVIGPEVLGMAVRVNRFTTEGKADLVALLQDFTAAIDSMIVCLFSSFALNPSHYARLLTTVTGREFGREDLFKIGERIWNLEKLFNLREGLSRDDDTLPPRFLEETLPEGGSRERVVRLREMLDEYYAIRGWTDQGVPTKEKLEELGLEGGHISA